MLLRRVGRFLGQSSSGGGTTIPAPTLAVVDNGDGTATASVIGGAIDATNVVSTQHISKPGSTWVVAGSLVGAGEVAIEGLEPGYYWAKVESSLSGRSVTSNIVYFAIVDPEIDATAFNALLTAVYERIVEMVDEGLLPGIDRDSVRVRLVPLSNDFGQEIGDTVAHAWPGIIISPGAAESIKPNDNARDAYGYPVEIGFIDAPAVLDPEADRDKYLAWRAALIKEFHSKYLTVTNPDATFHDCTFEGGNVFHWSEFVVSQVIASTFTLRFWIYERRNN